MTMSMPTMWLLIYLVQFNLTLTFLMMIFFKTNKKQEKFKFYKKKSKW